MTIASEDLRAAAEAGIITTAQAGQLAQFLSRRNAQASVAEKNYPELTTSDADNEKFRVLGGFNDIFAAIGVGLLYGALLAAGGVVAPVLLSVIGAVAAWGLSEIFARRLRLALPSILLTALFSVSVAITALLVAGMVDGSIASLLTARPKMPRSDVWLSGIYGITTGLAVSAAAYFHYKRFGVPIAWSIGASGLICVLFALIGFNTVMEWHRPLSAIAGFVVFAYALRLDMADPLRKTTSSDAAFWLHLLASPLIIHPVVGSLAGPLHTLTTDRAVLVLVVFMLFAIVSLTIDRRAFLVSALIYTGTALAYLVRGIGAISSSAVIVLTLLALAVVVLSLSAGWSHLRARIVPLLPLGRWADRLPPTAGHR